MNMNITKCSVVTFTCKLKAKTAPYDYKIQDTFLIRNSNIKERSLGYLHVKKNKVYTYMVSNRSMFMTFEIQKVSIRRNKQGILFVLNIVNNIKPKDSGKINFMKFEIPKIKLRILQKDCF